jgi:hypothetical protein
MEEPIVIYPDSDDQSAHFDETSIFLAGSIEMGAADEWQQDAVIRISEALPNEDLVFYNPRRAEFNESFIEEQIVWEQTRLHASDYVFMVFDPKTKSPISLLEFGEFVGSDKLITVCDSSFYRFDNLVLTARYNGQEIYPDIDAGIRELTYRIHHPRG